MLTTLDLLDPRRTKLTDVYEDYATKEWRATVLFKGKRYKVSVTDDGTHIEELR